MPSGFVYVLVNPALPGLIKVGKTTRTPDARSLELSGATGVPSPFIVVYEQPVSDCGRVEAFVHAELERRGHRHASNREFFSAPVHEIVALVSQVANELGGTASDKDACTDDDDDQGSCRALAQELLEAGRRYEAGGTNALPDARAALKCYEQAAALGNSEAMLAAGEVCAFGGSGLRSNLNLAVTNFDAALRSGEWTASARLAHVLGLAGRGAIAREHWLKFFESFAAHAQAAQDEDRLRVADEVGADYIYSVVRGSGEHCVPDAAIRPIARRLLAVVDERIAALSADWKSEVPGSPERVALGGYRRGRSFIERIASLAP